MKKKFTILFLIIVVLVIGYPFFAYLTATNTYLKATNSVQIDVEESKKDTTAYAYYLVFEALMKEDAGLSDDIKYIAVDLTGTKLKDKESFLKMVENFCGIHHFTLLEDTLEGLSQKGYITDLTFNEGILIRFHNINHDKEHISMEGEKWRSGKGAVGIEYSLMNGNAGWKITKSRMNWIS